MYRSSPFRSTRNTNVITALGMCKVCTEAIHSVARKRQDWTCESTCEHENAKTRKRENGRNQPVDAKKAKTRKRRKRENKKTAKTGKTRKRENGENPKTRKRRKRRKPENGQKCSCFLVFNFSFSGFLGFLGFLVFSFSGFLVPLAASFWPGRVFYVLRGSWYMLKNVTELSGILIKCLRQEIDVELNLSKFIVCAAGSTKLQVYRIRCFSFCFGTSHWIRLQLLWAAGAATAFAQKLQLQMGTLWLKPNALK